MRVDKAQKEEDTILIYISQLVSTIFLLLIGSKNRVKGKRVAILLSLIGQGKRPPADSYQTANP